MNGMTKLWRWVLVLVLVIAGVACEIENEGDAMIREAHANTEK